MYGRYEHIIINMRFCSLYSHIDSSVASVACTHRVFRRHEVASPRAGLVNILFGTAEEKRGNEKERKKNPLFLHPRRGEEGKERKGEKKNSVMLPLNFGSSQKYDVMTRGGGYRRDMTQNMTREVGVKIIAIDFVIRNIWKAPKLSQMKNCCKSAIPANLLRVSSSRVRGFFDMDLPFPSMPKG